MNIHSKLWLIIAITFCLGACKGNSSQQSFTTTFNDKLTLKNFRLQSSAVVHKNGKQLSSGAYQGKAYWFPVKVPSTVLTGLVANDVYPNPYIGLNNMLIPDASDSVNRVQKLGQYSHMANQKNPWKDPYWYRTTFELPQNFNHSRTWLHFDGINYRAAVWLNRHQIADSTDMVGMFRTYDFDATKYINKTDTNYLAVKIYPLDYSGLPAPPQLKVLGPFYPNGGPTGDIGKNVTMLSSVGWDWMPAVRDRNMGLWQPVYLTGSNAVAIQEPQIMTELPDLPDTSRAGLKLKLNLANKSDQKKDGTLNIDISPKNFSGSSIHLSRDISVNAGQHKKVHLAYKNVDELDIHDPHLWWPINYGNHNLYTLKLSYEADGKTSDVKKVTFGIRQVGSKVTDVNGWARRDFSVNGKQIDLTGGAWVPDMMLQRDSLRYKQELELIANGNMNTVRIWGGGIAPPDYFFDVADSLGLLVWQDFWITGDTNGGFKGSQKWPLQTDVFKANVQSTIKRLRNHPSLLVWTGGNENHPRKELFDIMRNSVAKLDSTRSFISSSSGFAELPDGWKRSWPGNTKTGVYSGGPYSWQEPEQYYELVNQGKDWVWKDEVGMPSQPVYSNLPKVIPNLVADTTQPYPFNKTWSYHDAAEGNGEYSTYYKAIKNRYGKLKGYKDYSHKAQLVNANGYRAIFESVGGSLRKTGGVLLWKTNAAWPSVIWQLYDWYLTPNAGYYFTKRSIEPLHVQLQLDDSTITLVNRQYKSRDNLSVHACFYDQKLNKTNEETFDVQAPAATDTTVKSLKSELSSAKGLRFLSLQMQDDQGNTVSRNLYWLSPNDDFTKMQSLPKADISVTSIDNDSNNQYEVHLKNDSKKLAFFIHLKMENAQGDEILPSYWEDNYFSILPRNSRNIHVNLQDAPKAYERLYLKMSGQNVPIQRLQIRDN